MNTKRIIAIRKLDNVLKILSDSTEAEIQNNVPIAILDVFEISEFYKNAHKTELKNHEFNLIIDKLLKDDYIFKEQIDKSQPPRFGINYIGYIFNSEGGYEQKMINDDDENTRMDKIEENQKFHRRALTWLTSLVAVGTLIAAIYYSVELLKYFHVLPDPFHC